MPTKSEGILDSGYWQSVQPESKLSAYARSLRSVRWNFDGFRPLLLKQTDSPNAPLRRTAYLDGLRGFAALLVYWHHHQLWVHDATGQNPIFENAFGHKNNYYFACFHGVRTFFTGGHYAVSMFFIISGYVLAVKPMSLIHAGDQVKLSENLASAFFRRWLRLYIPLVCTTFVYMTSWHAFGIWAAAAEPEPTWLAEVWKWYSEFKNFSFVFRQGGEPWFTYNFHLWSIPVEFKGSIVIYTSLMAFSRCSRNARLWCQAGLIFYFMYIADGWYCALFVAGMLLCDLDLLADRDKLPSFFSYFESFKELIFFNLFTIGVYLGGVPSQTLDVSTLLESPGWRWLAKLKPQAVFDYKWFFLFWAAVFTVSAVPRLPWLKRFFETRFCQYLGRICFGLYLVHGPVLWTFGDRVYAAIGWSNETRAAVIPLWYNKLPLSKMGPMGLEPSFLLMHIILLPVTLWTAEIVTRLFDEPSVRLMAWFYKKTLAPNPKL